MSKSNRINHSGNQLRASFYADDVLDGWDLKAASTRSYEAELNQIDESPFYERIDKVDGGYIESVQYDDQADDRFSFIEVEED